MNIHPSQRRFSCEGCKKHKAKCQRLQQTDLICSRCTMLGVYCQPGSQKKVGRPKRSERIFEHKVLKSIPISSDVRSKKANKEYRQSLMSHQSILCPGGSDDRPVPILVTPRTTSSPITSHPLMSIRTPKELSLLTEPASWQLQASAPNERVRIDSDNGSGPTDQYIATILPPLSLSSDDTLDHEPDWPDMATIPASIHANSLGWLAPPGQQVRYYSHEVTGELYFDTRLRTVMNECTSVQHNPTNHSEPPDIADTLSRIMKDMDLRHAIIRRNKLLLSLDTLIYRQSPLFIGNYTLSEFLISASQDFLHVLYRLQASRRWKPSPSFHATAASPERLPQALAHTISSIFSQLVSFYELFLEHLTSRIEHISTHPVAPIPGLTLNGKLLDRPCDQGLLFCDIVLGLLEKLANVLGLEMGSGGKGLLSSKQVDALWGEMDGSDGVASGYGIMRPADVKALFRKVAAVFERLSLTM
jgi:hypothetical protein